MSLAGVAAAIGGIGVGCAPHKPGATTREYRTVAGDPERDAEVARRENDRCVGFLKEKKWGAAEAAGKAALAADLMFGPAHNNLGKAYFGEGKLYLAAWEFQYAAKLMPGLGEPKNNLGLVCEAAGKLEEAQGWYVQGLEAGENPEILGNLARVRVKRGERGADVRELLEKVAMRDERAEWREWARGQLVMMKNPEKESTSGGAAKP